MNENVMGLHELEKLAELKEKGILTEAEYLQEKSKLFKNRVEAKPSLVIRTVDKKDTSSLLVAMVVFGIVIAVPILFYIFSYIYPLVIGGVLAFGFYIFLKPNHHFRKALIFTSVILGIIGYALITYLRLNP